MDKKKREAYFKRVEQEPFARLLNIKLKEMYLPPLSRQKLSILKVDSLPQCWCL